MNVVEKNKEKTAAQGNINGYFPKCDYFNYIIMYKSINIIFMSFTEMLITNLYFDLQVDSSKIYINNVYSKILGLFL